jgi:hypothetical protein
MENADIIVLGGVLPGLEPGRGLLRTKSEVRA